MTICDGKDSSMQPPANAIILPTLNEEVGDSGSGSDSDNDIPDPVIEDISDSDSGHDESFWSLPPVQNEDIGGEGITKAQEYFLTHGHHGTGLVGDRDHLDFTRGEGSSRSGFLNIRENRENGHDLINGSNGNNYNLYGVEDIHLGNGVRPRTPIGNHCSSKSNFIVFPFDIK